MCVRRKLPAYKSGTINGFQMKIQYCLLKKKKKENIPYKFT